MKYVSLNSAMNEHLKTENNSSISGKSKSKAKINDSLLLTSYLEKNSILNMSSRKRPKIKGMRMELNNDL